MIAADAVEYVRQRLTEDITQMERDGRIPPQPTTVLLSNASRYWQRRELFHRRRKRLFIRLRITPWPMPQMVTVHFQGHNLEAAS